MALASGQVSQAELLLRKQLRSKCLDEGSRTRDRARVRERERERDRQRRGSKLPVLARFHAAHATVAA